MTRLSVISKKKHVKAEKDFGIFEWVVGGIGEKRETEFYWSESVTSISGPSWKVQKVDFKSQGEGGRDKCSFSTSHRVFFDTTPKPIVCKCTLNIGVKQFERFSRQVRLGW